MNSTYKAGIVCQVTGLNPSTLSAWRAKNYLQHIGIYGDGSTMRLSFAQVCALKIGAYYKFSRKVETDLSLYIAGRLLPFVEAVAESSDDSTDWAAWFQIKYRDERAAYDLPSVEFVPDLLLWSQAQLLNSDGWIVDLGDLAGTMRRCKTLLEQVEVGE